MDTAKIEGSNVLKYFSGKTVAVLGYRDDGGKQQASFLRNNGIQVVIGLREEDEVWNDALEDGFHVYDVWNAVFQADIAQVW